MNSTEPISIREVKREARALYRGRYRTAIKINIIPIILSILSVYMMSLAAYTFWGFATAPSPQVADSASAVSQINDAIENILSSAIEMMFIWTTSWTLIDWFEKPLVRPTLKETFQIFRRGNVFHTFLLTIVQSVLLFLWTLLFVIPGIIKLFAYSQTYFAYKIDLENGTRQRQLTDYITISRRVMNGRKWELFLLELSFIGWHLLGILTAGLAYIYVVPYLNATRVAYSRHLFTMTLAKRGEQ